MTRTGKFLLLLATTALSGAAATALGGSALAQSIGALATGSSASGDKNAPVSFTADSLSYDKTGKIITATGHVVAIQNGQTLHADKVTINRATNVVTADGHVVLTQPDGSNTVYA